MNSLIILGILHNEKYGLFMIKFFVQIDRNIKPSDHPILLIVGILHNEKYGLFMIKFFVQTDRNIKLSDHPILLMWVAQEWLAYVVSRFVCSYRMIVDTSSNQAPVCGKLL